MQACKLSTQPAQLRYVAKSKLHASPATLHLIYSSYFCLPSTEPRIVNLFRRFVDETNFDPELFWENFDWSLYSSASPVFPGELKNLFPSSTFEDPETPLLERIERMAWNRQLYCSPRDLAYVLNIDSLEAAYPRLKDHRKRYLLGLAFNQWGSMVGHHGAAKASGIWEETMQALFAAGAQFEVLCSQKAGEHPGNGKPGIPGDEIVVELIRHFVRPYAWETASHRGYPLEVRDFLRGFQFLISRLKHLGIKLETISSYKRLEVRFGEDFTYDHYRPDPWIPLTLKLYYDDVLSTWVLWDSMYEEYCGEFWDLLQHPERKMPGTWFD
jgi:hypothetical protein